MSTLSWTLELVDRISPSAKAAMRALAGVQSQLRAVQGALGRRMADPFSGALAGARRLRGGLQTLGQSGRRALAGLAGGPVAQLGAGLAASAAAAGVGVVALGRNIVQQAAYRESALTSLRASLGTSEEAAVAFRNAIQIANQTPLDTNQVVDATNQLAGAGFRGGQLTSILSIATDVGAVGGNDAMASVIRAVGQIRAKGKLASEELMQIREAAPSIAQHLTPALAQVMNITGDEATVSRGVQAAISAGRVSGEMFNRAFLEAGRRMNGATGGALGGVARAQSQTLGGSLSNLSNAWDNLLLMMNDSSGGLANLPGLQAFRETINATIGALDVSTPGGMRAMTALSTLISGVFGALFGGAGAEGQTVIDRIITAVEQATPAISMLVGGVRSFTEGLGAGFMAAVGPAIELMQQLGTEGGDSGTMLRDVGRAVGYIAGAFILGVGVIGGAVTLLFQFLELVWEGAVATWGDLTRLFEGVVTFFSDLPRRIVDGFLAMMRLAWRGAVVVVEGLVELLPTAVRAVLGIHSPSRVMMQIGAQTVAGMEAGILGGQRDVENAMALIVSPRAGSGAGPGAARGGGPISVQVVVHTDARDADGVGDAVAARLEALFADLFERAALGVG